MSQPEDKEDSLASLSIRELKERLVLTGIDASTFRERTDLVQALRLQQKSAEIIKKRPATSSTLIRNPYASKPKAAKVTPTGSGKKKPAPSLTPLQLTRIEENRQRAAELRAAERRKTACPRCGCDASENTLCLVWLHEGDIQREWDGYNRRDIFRFECCGREDPSPCFIGRHLSPSSSSSSGSTACLQVHCTKCGSRAKLFRTHKDSPNCGRYFFKCPQRECSSFFQWADTAYGLPPQIPTRSDDGVKEWVHIYGNPFSEGNILGGSVTPELGRRRLLGALEIREMVTMVAVGPLVCTFMPVQEFLENVLGKISKKEKPLTELLWPLKASQLDGRFGTTEVPEEVTLEELQDALTAICERHCVLRTTVKLGDTDDTPWIDLVGFETYLAV